MVLTLGTDHGNNDNIVFKQLIDQRCAELAKRWEEKVERGFQEIMKNLKLLVTKQTVKMTTIIEKGQK